MRALRSTRGHWCVRGGVSCWYCRIRAREAWVVLGVFRVVIWVVLHLDLRSLHGRKERVFFGRRVGVVGVPVSESRVEMYGRRVLV